MKRVVLLKSRSSSQGGLEKQAKRIADAFVKKGAKVTLLTTGKSVLENVYAVKTTPFPGFLRLEQFDAFCQKWIGENGADVIFGMDRNREQTHIRAGNGVHAAYLESRVHTEGRLKALLCKYNPLHKKILELEKASFEYRGLKKLFTNSHFVKRQVLEHYNVDECKVQVLHNGVEWHEMAKEFALWEEKPSTYFHLLFVGNGYTRKGLGQLLKALAHLQEKEVHLTVVGKDRQIDFYRDLSERLGLKERVHFMGPSQEISSFYRMADALVIPSFYDPFANVTIEALSMGLFVVSSKMNGGHEILTKQTGAIIEDLLDIDSIVGALKIALRRKKTKESARQIRQSVKQFDFSHQLEALVEASLG